MAVNNIRERRKKRRNVWPAFDKRRLSGGTPVVTAAPTTLPLDAVTGATAGYSVARRLRAAYAGSAIRIRRDSDNAELDIGFTGDALDAAAAAAFIGGGAGYLTTIYDQTVNANNATQATAGNQPLYVASGQNSKPTGRYLLASSQFMSANGVAASYTGSDMPATVVAPVKFSSVAAQADVWEFNRSSNANPIFRLGSTTAPAYAIVRRDDAGTSATLTTGTSSTASMVLSSTIFTGTVVGLFLNGAQSGVDTAMNVGTITLDRFTLGAFNSTSVANYLSGDLPELLIYPSALSVGDRGTLESNLNTFYVIY